MAEPRFLVAGDAALIVELGDAIDPAINRRVRGLFLAAEGARLAGVRDLVPTYRSLLVSYDPLQTTFAALRERLSNLDAHLDDAPVPPPRVVEIPTAYGGAFGPDLGFVAAHNGLAEDEVVAIHSGTDYLVYMMGFSPGFTYLGGLSERIAAPRLDTPRTAIPAGSVGIAQMQTGIYPVESPGGWRLIGRTPVSLFDPSRHPPVLVDAGDSIRFLPVTPDEYASTLDAVRRGAWAPRGTEHHAVKIIEVVDGGMLTTVQDLGRYGYQRYGVPTSGAMDLFSLRAANRLVGNPDHAACLEMTLVAPRLRFVAPATIAVTGADLGARIDGNALPMWQSVLVEPGAEILVRRAEVRHPRVPGGGRGRGCPARPRQPIHLHEIETGRPGGTQAAGGRRA